MSVIHKLWSTHDKLIHIEKEEFLRAVYKVSDRSCEGKDGDGVRPAYAKNYAKEANWILVAYRSGAVNRRGVSSEPVGFILGSRTEDNIYLGVICSDPGFGGGLLKYFNEYADKSHISASLDAVPKVLGLYSRDDFGYEFRKSCKPGSEILDSSPVKGKKPSSADITEDPVFAPFIEKLQHNEFNVNKEGKCKNKNLKIKQIFGEQCFNYGFTMFRCPTSKAKRFESPNKPKQTRFETRGRSPIHRSPKSPKSPKERSPRSPRVRRRSSRSRSRIRSRY